MTILFLCSQGRKRKIRLYKDGIVSYPLDGAPWDIDKLGTFEAENTHIPRNKYRAYLSAGKVYEQIANIP
jgi:hypothetical protein